MAKQLYANNAKSSLAAGISPGTTVFSVAAGEGARFPTPTGGDYFLATIEVSGSVEIVKVTTRSTDTFTAVRAQEGTSAATWPQGTLIEMRVTRDTLTSFARQIDVLPEIATLDLLVAPGSTSFTSYLIHSNDDEGMPINAVRDTSTKWRFLNHHKILTTTVTSATTTSVTQAALAGKLPSVVAGKYIVQFTSGTFAGQARLVTGAVGTTISWGPVLGGTPSGGDAIEIYQSTYSLINGASADASSGLAYAIVFGET